MSPSSFRLVVSSLTLVALATGTAVGQTELQRPGLPETDAAFITNVGEAENAELVTAKLALSRSTNPDVRAFARSTIAENGRENAALAKVGTAVGHAAPTGVDAAEAANDARLRTLRGAAFDRAYVASEVGGRKLNFDKNVQPELRSGGNVAVKGFATAYARQLQAQQRRADALETRDHL